MKPLAFLIVAGALVTYIFVSGVGSTPWIGEGRRAPKFTVKDLNGTQVSLEALEGRVIFLNFWSTDCPPCAAEMPDLERVAKHFAGRKFEMMAVSLDLNAGDVARFYRDRNLSMPAYLDPHKKVAGKYNVRATPESFVIDSTGNVARYYIGRHAWTSPQMLAMLDGMIPD